MDYKELIKEMREFTYWLGQSGPESHDIHPPACEKWATAVETLLAEREAAMKYIPHNCQTCKWWEAVKPGMACCKAPDDAGPCYLGRGKAWQWRGPTHPDRQKEER